MSTEATPLNFIEQAIETDLAEGKNDSKVHTRFPPEPNGYLHIGHAKSIVLNFGTANKYNGECNLRFDDTNPEKEETEYVTSIKEDLAWLGYSWGNNEFFASDYFDRLYEYAMQLIKIGKAYVDDQSAEDIRATRGTPTSPGTESPFRGRSVEENLQLFEEMKAGNFENGAKVLRAKIDMTSPNMHMRDPALYRIRKEEHHRTGNDWCIYPMYDFAHGLSDSIEGVTHSLCTLEFEVHRPLYNWILEQLEVFHPQQIEFARLNLSYTILSKRKLLQLVEGGYVNGWDDPRMPTISGLRRRGYTSDAIKAFAQKVGVAKRNGITDVALLEHSVREDLNKKSTRVMGILDPIKLIITNYPEGDGEIMKAQNIPEEESAGFHDLPFGHEVYIDRSDFMEDPPKKFFRLGPGREVRLKYAYIIECTDYFKDEAGNITEVHCTYDPETKSGSANSGKKVKGTLSWVPVKEAITAEVRLYDRLFIEENLNTVEGDFIEYLNPDSLDILSNAVIEPFVADAKPGDLFQFLRQGYYVVDKDSQSENIVFNRTVSLRDNWAKKGK